MKINRLLAFLFVMIMAITMITPVAAFVSVSPAYAQEGDPGTGTTDEAGPALGFFTKAGDFAMLLINVIALLVVSASFGERGTEIIKGLLRKISQIPLLHWAAVQGYGSVFLALLVAAMMIYYPTFNLDFLDDFAMFQNVSPKLVKIFNLLLLTLGSNYIHVASWFENIFSAPAINSLKFIDLPKLKKKTPAEVKPQ